MSDPQSSDSGDMMDPQSAFDIQMQQKELASTDRGKSLYVRKKEHAEAQL